MSVSSGTTERTDRVAAATDADASVLIGPTATEVESAYRLDDADRPASLEAADLVATLGKEPDSILALAGAFAAGVDPDPHAADTGSLLETARDNGGARQRPGVAVPTADPIDGLAHSTQLCAPWSGDLERVREEIGDVLPESFLADVSDGTDSDPSGDEPSEEVHRRLGSLVAIDVAGAEWATDRAGDFISRVLRPYSTPAGPFETVAGYADVLEAVARQAPGVGVTLAIGHGARDDALDAWRTHGRRVHEALESAESNRHDGLWVLTGPGVDAASAPSVARLAVAYRSPEPVALAVGDDGVAVATVDEPAGPIVESAGTELGESYDYGHRVGTIHVDDSTRADVIQAVRGGL